MAQYIDKGAVIAKIDELIGNLRYTEDDEALQIDILSEVEKFVNTLEVKEVDLENMICDWLNDNCDDAGYYNQVQFAKHFFELGLKQSSNEVKDVNFEDVCMVDRETAREKSILDETKVEYFATGKPTIAAYSEDNLRNQFDAGAEWMKEQIIKALM